MAEQKIKYATPATITIAPENVATSATLVAGVESAAIDNSTDLFVDALVSGKWTAGTSPTGGEVDIWVYAAHDETPTYPDVIDGTSSAETFGDVNSRNSALRLAAVIAPDTTNDQVYWVAPFSVAALFGGVMPRRWGLWITHSTGVNSNSTGGNHAWKMTGINFTVA